MLTKCFYCTTPDSRIERVKLNIVLFVGKVSWVREEALASILSVEMVDLPVSQIMAKMEDEFGTKGIIINYSNCHILLFTSVSFLMTCDRLFPL